MKIKVRRLKLRESKVNLRYDDECNGRFLKNLPAHCKGIRIRYEQIECFCLVTASPMNMNKRPNENITLTDCFLCQHAFAILLHRASAKTYSNCVPIFAIYPLTVCPLSKCSIFNKLIQLTTIVIDHLFLQAIDFYTQLFYLIP